MIISYKYNWDKIRTEYETGKYTLKQLADKHGQSKSFYSYLRQKSSGEKWEVDEEVSKKLTEEVQKRVIGAEAEKEAELRKEYEKIINNIRRGAYKALFKEKDFSRLKQFKIASEIIKNLRKEQWEVNGIQEVAKKVEQKIEELDEEKEKLEEERKKIFVTEM